MILRQSPPGSAFRRCPPEAQTGSDRLRRAPGKCLPAVPPGSGGVPDSTPGRGSAAHASRQCLRDLGECLTGEKLRICRKLVEKRRICRKNVENLSKNYEFVENLSKIGRKTKNLSKFGRKKGSGPYRGYSKPRLVGVSRVGGGAALEAFSEEGFGGRVAAENWAAFRLAPSGGKKGF